MHRNVVSVETPIILQSNCYLVVLHADKIPPHIGFLMEGSFFSQKARGKDVGLDISRLLTVINNKKIPTLFYAIESPIYKHPKTIFDNLPNKIEVGKTCLDPVCQVLTDEKRFAIVAELLTYLEENEAIGTCFGLHIPRDFETLPTYSRDDVERRIAKLTNDKRS
jgi:hypothetical protein